MSAIRVKSLPKLLDTMGDALRETLNKAKGPMRGGIEMNTEGETGYMSNSELGLVARTATEASAEPIEGDFEVALERGRASDGEATVKVRYWLEGENAAAAEVRLRDAVA